MHKLVSISNSKSSLTRSASNPTLPPIKKSFCIPLHSDSNSIIAKKIIEVKPTIDSQSYLKRNQTIEERKKNISKYNRSSNGSVINRKKYLA
jgi:hypothetical protein